MSTRYKQHGVRSRSVRTAFMTVVGVLTATFVAAALVGNGSGVAAADQDGPGHGGAYEIGLWGDLPYSPLQDTVGVPNLIADMNAQHLAFTVNDGDLKAGGSRCDNAVYARALEFFDSLEAPAMFTPGNNDWTDCDRASAGGYSSRERLDYERQLFFSTRGRTGTADPSWCDTSSWSHPCSGSTDRMCPHSMPRVCRTIRAGDQA